MAYAVFLTDGASRDLEDICDYIDLHNLPSKAEHVLERIEKAIKSLYKSPRRGTYPKELLALGIREYRQIFFKPYRIIYRIIEKNIYILLIVDGRRDMQRLLQQRLLEA